jgi:hypothetical protein
MNELESLELKIAKFLRYGVLAAGLLMLIGWGASIPHAVDPFAHLKQHTASPLMDRLTVHVMAGEWPSILAYAGLSLLIALPLIRVLLTAILFIKQKELLLAGIASLVLIGLFLSFSLGFQIH